MSERDDHRHLAAGAGAPADPGLPTGGRQAGPDDNDPVSDQNGAADPRSEESLAELVQALTEFVNDLVDGEASGEPPNQE